jgi:SAM-dependent methyltransferase
MVFSAEYAGAYDLLYRDKDYESECATIVSAFGRFASGEVRKVLDWGCGTGGHAIPLSRRGYEVTGIDRSASMLALAREKAAARGAAVRWVEGDMRTAAVEGVYDAGLLMFAVLGYVTETSEVVQVLRNCRHHLKSGAPLVFDVWYGPAVLASRPEQRVRTIVEGGQKTVRVVTPSLDSRHHLCTVRYHLLRVEGARVTADEEEEHVMRYFFPLELELMLELAGFRLASLSAFPSLELPLGEGTWNALAVAVAAG